MCATVQILKPLGDRWVPLFVTPGKVPLGGSNNTPKTDQVVSDPAFSHEHMYCKRETHPAHLHTAHSSAFVKAMMDRESQQMRSSQAGPVQAQADAVSYPGLTDSHKLEYGNQTGYHSLTAAQEASKRDHGVVSYKVADDDLAALPKYRIMSARLDAEHRNSENSREQHPIPAQVKVGV